MKKADRPDLPAQKHTRPPEPLNGFTEAKTCANCQHYDTKKGATREGKCHNGISGRRTTRPIDGCAFGFYPSVERFPLCAGPGGVFGTVPQA
jgi:hypothetical protein